MISAPVGLGRPQRVRTQSEAAPRAQYGAERLMVARAAKDRAALRIIAAEVHQPQGVPALRQGRLDLARRGGAVRLLPRLLALGRSRRRCWRCGWAVIATT